MTQVTVRSGYSEPSYIDQIAERIATEAGGDLSLYWAPLFRMYAVLALTKGVAVTARDVHDAWSAWCAGVDPEHRSLKPFDQLAPEVQALDEPYVQAICAVALHLEARP